MRECNQCTETINNHYYLKFNDVIYYFCRDCYFEYMKENEE